MMAKKDFSKLLNRAVAEIIVREELERLLAEDKPLRLKMGFDPSRPDIHLGHMVGLRKLRQFQELGHKVILIVGDWTAQIGDPSGQSATRPMLTAEEVRENAKTYMEQFFKIVDRDKTAVRWQSEWFGKFTLADVIKLANRFTVAQMLARDDFAKRYATNRPIAITEFLYPLLQAYDSIMVEADVEFGGTDQTFNLLLGRELQQQVGKRPQQCFTVPILVGTDGVQRMSKSLDNYIGVAEAPRDIYFKVMRLSDDLMPLYFELVTDVPDKELKEIKRAVEGRAVNPMEVKKRLAREILLQLYSEKDVRQAEWDFERIVQRKEAPDQLIEVTIYSGGTVVNQSFIIHSEPLGMYSLNLPQLLAEKGITKTKGEARRLIDSGGTSIGDQQIQTYLLPVASPSQSSAEKTSEQLEVHPGTLIKAGKRHTIKIIDAD